MSTLVNWNGQQYLVPAYNDTGYAQGNGNLSQYLVAISTGSLQQVGGLFQLTADADFGPNFGLVSSYYKSRSANIASAGVLRLANTDAIKWRNSDNSADVTLAMNATGTAARTYTIPDFANSYFVMSEGAQTINGAKSFSEYLLIQDGTAALPGLSFIGETGRNTGLYLVGQNNIGITTQGVLKLDVGVAAITAAIPLAMGANKITGLAAGSGAGDAVRYEQVLLLTGGTMAGNIAMGGTYKLTGLAAGSGNGDSLRYEQLVGVYLPLSGGTMAGNITMNTNRILGLPVPTIQKFLSGSGTYTTPANCLYIHIEMVGGGGGGGGSGTAAGTAATAGGNTTFGTTLLVANGGGRGNFGNVPIAGGSASLGTGPIGIALQGGIGGGTGAASTGSSTNGVGGGMGASSPFGGAGGGGTITLDGQAAIANTGSGGGGGATTTGTNEYGGSGGSAGGYVKALIASPSATYSYAVGAKGDAGGAGTSGKAGGDGGSGLILVTEYYQ